MTQPEWDTVTRLSTTGVEETWRERILDPEQAAAVGPVGSGVMFRVLKDDWVLADDGVWERTIHKLELV